MLISRTKKRYPVFGAVYKYLRTYMCDSCYNLVSLWENWSGPKPAGGIRCPKCEGVIKF